MCNNASFFRKQALALRGARNPIYKSEGFFAYAMLIFSKIGNYSLFIMLEDGSEILK